MRLRRQSRKWRWGVGNSGPPRRSQRGLGGSPHERLASGADLKRLALGIRAMGSRELVIHLVFLVYASCSTCGDPKIALAPLVLLVLFCSSTPLLVSLTPHLRLLFLYQELSRVFLAFERVVRSGVGVVNVRYYLAVPVLPRLL